MRILCECDVSVMYSRPKHRHFIFFNWHAVAKIWMHVFNFFEGILLIVSEIERMFAWDWETAKTRERGRVRKSKRQREKEEQEARGRARERGRREREREIEREGECV